MTKTVRVVFDGKTFVPDDAEGVPVGAIATLTVHEVGPKFTTGQEAIDALAGLLTPAEADEMLGILRELRPIEPDDRTRA